MGVLIEFDPINTNQLLNKFSSAILSNWLLLMIIDKVGSSHRVKEDEVDDLA